MVSLGVVGGILFVFFTILAIMSIVADFRHGQGKNGSLVFPKEWWRRLLVDRRKVLLVGALAGAFFVLSTFVVYYLATSSERTEKKAVDQLVEKVNRLNSGIPYPIPVGEKSVYWAKQRFYHEDIKWTYERTQSSAFPFSAAIISEIKKVATVYHSTEKAAWDDDQFYPFDGYSFYPTPDEYKKKSIFILRSRWTTKMLYDKSKEEWIDQGTKEEWGNSLAGTR